jgi:hypothetical protein
VTDDSEFDFAPGERDALADLQQSLPQIAEWPPDSPVSFVLMLASRTRGKLGEGLLARFGHQLGLQIGRPDSVAYDLRVGGARCEVKFSTEDPPRFQQVRDPRLANGTLKYDYLVGVSARPHQMLYWLIPATELGQLMDDGYITVQHAMSDTKWFLPSRTLDDSFSKFRYGYDDFLRALRSLP